MLRSAASERHVHRMPAFFLHPHTQNLVTDMLSLSKILVPYDFSVFSKMALRQAADIARLYKASLHIVHVEVMHELPALEPAAGAKRAELLRKRIEQENSGDPELLEGIVVHFAVAQDFAAGPPVIDYVSQYDVDLIVVGTHGRRGLGRVFLGSVAEEIVRLAPCPVMTVRDDTEAPVSIAALKRILVPVDFSTHSEEALAYAKAIAVHAGATLDLLHVVPVNSYPTMNDTGAFAMYAAHTDEIEVKALEHLKKLFERVPGSAGDVEYHILHGTGAHEIVEAAQEMKSDLIVIGTHGLTGIERFMLGSVTARTVRRAPCPVFIVKSFGKSLLHDVNTSEEAAMAEE